MLLQTVYQKNKLLFYSSICVIGLQLFINLKHGIVATPFHHYGMFSAPYAEKDTITVVDIYINNKKLSPQQFNHHQWDHLVTTATNFFDESKHNSLFYHSEVTRIGQQLGIQFSSNRFLQNVSTNSFLKSYATLIESIVHQKVHSVKIGLHQYTISNLQLIYTGKSEWLQ